MRVFLSAALIAMAIATPAAADCTGEIVAAFEKQKKAPQFRLESVTFSADGNVTMTVDYQAPDKMHQTVTPPNAPAPLETIAVARWAWGNQGGGWEELQPQFAQAITSHVQETFRLPVQQVGAYACLGKVTFEGKEYLGYRAEHGPGDQATGGESLTRIVYVDPASGLPAVNLVMPTGANDPVFKGIYSYPKDMVIEAPVAVPAPPRQ